MWQPQRIRATLIRESQRFTRRLAYIAAGDPPINLPYTRHALEERARLTNISAPPRSCPDPIRLAAARASHHNIANNVNNIKENCKHEHHDPSQPAAR